MKNELEDILKKKFSDFEAEPAAGLFDKIVQKSRSNRRLIWFRTYRKWWAAAALLLLAGSWWVLSLDPPAPVDPIAQEDHQEDQFQPKNEEFRNIAPQGGSPSLEEDVEHSETVQPRHNAVQSPPQAAFISEREETIPEADRPQADPQVSDPDAERKSPVVYKDDLKPEAKDQFVPEDEDVQTDEDVVQLTPDENKVPDKEAIDDGDLVGASRIPSRFSIALSIAPGYAYRKLNGTDESYSAQRNHTENSALSWQWSADLRYRLNSKWNISSGLRYSQRNENFLYRDVSSVSDTQINSQQITVYHPVNPPQQITVYDTAITENTYIAITETMNRYKVLSIPLEVERIFYFYDKWSVMTRAGILLNAYSAASGNVIQPGGDLGDLTSLPRNEGELRMSLGLGTAYRLNETVSLLLYPQLNYGLISTWNRSVAMKQYEYGFYTHLGMRIDL